MQHRAATGRNCSPPVTNQRTNCYTRVSYLTIWKYWVQIICFHFSTRDDIPGWFKYPMLSFARSRSVLDFRSWLHSSARISYCGWLAWILHQSPVTSLNAITVILGTLLGMGKAGYSSTANTDTGYQKRALRNMHSFYVLQTKITVCLPCSLSCASEAT